MKYLKFSLLFLTGVLLTSCANLIGTVSGGFYTSINQQFKVKTPAIPKLSVQDGKLNERIFVDFYQSRGYWKKYGLYSIEWYKPIVELNNKKTFYSYTKKSTPSFVKSNFGSRGTFNVIDTRKMQVNDRISYQFIANGILDNVDAVWVGTLIQFGQHIALISVVSYSENSTNEKLFGATVQAKIPWNKYNSFLHSFTSLKPR